MTDCIDWPSTGPNYRYWFLLNPSTSTAIKAEAGNYMFVKRVQNGWVPVYIGIATDLSARIPCHDRWDEAARLGATHVMAHVQPDKAQREAEERNLIGYWNPPLSTQHCPPRRASLLG